MKPVYEVFCDHSYYDQWAVRPAGERRWGHCYHLPSKEEAEGLANELSNVAPCVHAEEREKELIRLATEALLVATAALGVWGDKLAPGTLEDFRCKERAFLRYALKESDEP